LTAAARQPRPDLRHCRERANDDKRRLARERKRRYRALLKAGGCVLPMPIRNSDAL
jgi:hypothetical protein